MFRAAFGFESRRASLNGTVTSPQKLLCDTSTGLRIFSTGCTQAEWTKPSSVLYQMALYDVTASPTTCSYNGRMSSRLALRTSLDWRLASSRTSILHVATRPSDAGG